MIPAHRMKPKTESTARFEIPASGRVVASLVMTLFYLSFILFFVALAVKNLINGTAIISSLIWLFLVISMLVLHWTAEGGG